MSPNNKLGIIKNSNIKEPKIDFKINHQQKTTVKTLTHVQSALAQKYPNITNNQQSLKKLNSLNNINDNSTEKNSILTSKQDNNRASFEEKKTNINFNEKGFNFISNNKSFSPKKLISHLSPNVQILQHSVEQFYEKNNPEKYDLNEMINNFQKYIKGY